MRLRNARIRKRSSRSRERNLHVAARSGLRKQTDTMAHQHDAEERGAPTSVSARVSAQIRGRPAAADLRLFPGLT